MPESPDPLHTAFQDAFKLHGKWNSHGAAPDGAPIRGQGCNTKLARLQPAGRSLFVIDNPSAPGAE